MVRVGTINHERQFRDRIANPLEYHTLLVLVTLSSDGEPLALRLIGMKRLIRVASHSQSSVVVGRNGAISPDSADWRDRVPVLRSGKVTLRELQPSDAQA